MNFASAGQKALFHQITPGENAVGRRDPCSHPLLTARGLKEGQLPPKATDRPETLLSSPASTTTWSALTEKHQMIDTDKRERERLLDSAHCGVKVKTSVYHLLSVSRTRYNIITKRRSQKVTQTRRRPGT